MKLIHTTNIAIALGILAFLSVQGQSSVPASKYFSPTDSLPCATVAHSAVTLNDSRVLVTGGYFKLLDRLPIASSLVRIYDPRTAKWQVSDAHLHDARLSHSMITLPDGRVLIVGGINQARQRIKSVELFIPGSAAPPATNSSHLQPVIVPVGNLQIARSLPCLNLLPADQNHHNLRVLVTGYSSTAEIIEIPNASPANPANPANPTSFTIRPATHTQRSYHSNHNAVTLDNGKVVILGGNSKIIEWFDPQTETFYLYQSKLPELLDDQQAILISGGKILLVAGQSSYLGTCINQTWIFNPAEDKLTAGPEAVFTSQGQKVPGGSDLMAADLFPDDKNLRGRYILLCGGESDPGQGKQPDTILDSALIYDASDNKLINVGPMITGHDDFAIAPLPRRKELSRVLIIAGHGYHDSFQSTCEIFTWHP